MNNEIKINVPEGMEIDKENSTFKCIKFKPKWIPKRGDIAVAEGFLPQFIIVGEYLGPEEFTGFHTKGLVCWAVTTDALSIKNDDTALHLWVEREATGIEKKQLIDRLGKKGYVYDPNDPRVIYKKEKELPKTWEEFCMKYPIKNEEAYVSSCSDIISAKHSKEERKCKIDKNLLPSEEYAEAMLALCQLVQLRDCYNDGWVPDWENSELKYIIQCFRNRIEENTTYHFNCVLSFKTKKLRDTFLNNFRDLIEKVKLLL